MHPHVDQEELLDQLASILDAVRGREELQTLLQGLLTPSEIEEVIFRWRLIRNLLAGKTQRAISQDLGLSLGKISRGSRLLKYGPPEFRALAERLLADGDAP